MTRTFTGWFAWGVFALACVVCVWRFGDWRLTWDEQIVATQTPPLFYHWLRHVVYDSTARQGGPLDCRGRRLVSGNVAVHPAGPLRQGDWVKLDGRWREACDVTADWVDLLTLAEFVPGSESRPATWRAEWRWVLARRGQ